MSDAAVACPLGEANLAHDSRLDPVVAAPAGRAARERRGRPLERTKLLADRLECPLVEPRADLGDVDQLALVVETQVQRAEMRPRALWHRVAADHELLPELTLDLQPVPRAFRGIGAVALLRDHAFQPLLAAGRVRPMRSWSRWKLERPRSSSATISPSRTKLVSGSACSAAVTSG